MSVRKELDTQSGVLEDHWHQGFHLGPVTGQIDQLWGWFWPSRESPCKDVQIRIYMPVKTSCSPYNYCNMLGRLKWPSKRGLTFLGGSSKKSENGSEWNCRKCGVLTVQLDLNSPCWSSRVYL